MLWEPDELFSRRVLSALPFLSDAEEIGPSAPHPKPKFTLTHYPASARRCLRRRHIPRRSGCITVLLPAVGGVNQRGSERAGARWSGIFISVARWMSPWALRPMTIGCVQPGTSRGTFSQMIGSRKIVPSRMLRMVPFGLRYIRFRSNSRTRARPG
jgi:hypothetical protein